MNARRNVDQRAPRQGSCLCMLFGRWSLVLVFLPSFAKELNTAQVAAFGTLRDTPSLPHTKMSFLHMPHGLQLFLSQHQSHWI